MVIIRGTVFNTSALATFFSPEGCCLISVKTGRIQLESNLVKQDKMFILTFVVYNLDSIIFELLIQLELEYKCPCGGEKAKLHATVQFIPKKTPTEKQTQIECQKENRCCSSMFSYSSQ